MIMKEHIKNKNDLSCAYDLLKDDGNSGVTKKYLNINGNIAQIFGDGHIEKLELTDVEYVLNNQSSYAAKKRDGTVIAWGEPESGRDTGAKQSQFTDIEQIVGSKSAFAAKKRDGTVITWGDAAFVGDPGEKQSQLTDVEYMLMDMVPLRQKNPMERWLRGVIYRGVVTHGENRRISRTLNTLQVVFMSFLSRNATAL